MYLISTVLLLGSLLSDPVEVTLLPMSRAWHLLVNLWATKKEGKNNLASNQVGAHVFWRLELGRHVTLQSPQAKPGSRLDTMQPRT